MYVVVCVSVYVCLCMYVWCDMSVYICVCVYVYMCAHLCVCMWGGCGRARMVGVGLKSLAYGWGQPCPSPQEVWLSGFPQGMFHWIPCPGCFELSGHTKVPPMTLVTEQAYLVVSPETWENSFGFIKNGWGIHGMAAPTVGKLAALLRLHRSGK